jgi:hypothetical protein
MRAAGLATMAYYYFDFRDVKKQERYGLLSSILPNSLPNPIPTPTFYPGYIRTMPAEQESPPLALLQSA